MNSKKLLIVIKKIVRQEVQRETKRVINEMLANKFLDVLADNKGYSLQKAVLSEEVSVKPQVERVTSTKEDPKERKKIEELKRSIMGDNSMSFLFEDVEPLPEAEDVDADGTMGEGVPLDFDIKKMKMITERVVKK